MLSHTRAALKATTARVLRRSPDFLVIGAQKAGTTSLHAYLAEHPALRPATGSKELHYFYLYYHRGLSWYLSHFPHRLAGDGKLGFEATPDYLFHPQVPARIRHDLGRIKLIAVLREPASRAYSAWKMWNNFADHPTKSAKADSRSFTDAIAEELAAPDGEADRHFHYVGMGLYADHLARFRRCFAEEDLLVLDYGEMNRDLPGFLGTICDFLGVVRFDAPTLATFGGTRHWVGPQRSPTDDDRATLERLRAYYAPYNERLFDMLGRRFDWEARSTAPSAPSWRGLAPSGGPTGPGTEKSERAR